MLDVLSDFHKNVIYMVVLLLIVSLVFIYVVMYFITKNKSKDDDPFPKQEQLCPDYWEDKSEKADGSKCVNTKNLGNSRNRTMDFSKSIWKGKDGICNKATWAKQCNLSWDGITNNTRQKCNTDMGIKERDYSIVPTTDYPGQFDMKEGEINGTELDCQNECDITTGCNAFVYDEKKQSCSLKNITDKNAAVPKYSPGKFISAIGTGFKSYKDAKDLCSSENKDQTCMIKEGFSMIDITEEKCDKTECKEGFTVENKSNLLKGSKCNVKLLDDGNLVMYDNAGKPLWASNTYNKGNGPYSLKMQDNGNLVVYDSNNENIWQSGTTDKGDGPYRATVDDTCTFSINDSNNTKIWKVDQSKSEKQKPGTCSSGINYGLCESKISSSTIDLVMQNDGNLVIYEKNGSYKWASGSNGKGTPPYRLMMQTDGNLVIYDKNNVATWASGTHGKGGNMLTVTDDKNVVMSSPSDKRIWSSRVDRNYAVLQNTDYSGQFDMKNLVGSTKECQNECDYLPGCNGFFYDNNGKRCYLKNIDKNTAAPRYKANGSLYVAGTGFKSFKDIQRSYNMIQNTDYGGQGDIKSMDGSKEDCQNECDATPGCNSFFYADAANRCWLKGLNRNNAVPNYHSGGSLFEAAGTGLISYKDKTPRWNAVGGENTTPNNFKNIGDTRTLDNFNVDCGGNKAIRRFHYGHNGGWDKGFRYKFNCSAPYIDGVDVTSSEVPSAYWNSTKLNDAGGGANIYLDRHAIDCGEDGAITQFNLNRMGTNNSYQYNYRCIKMKKPMSSRIVSTPANDYGWYHLAYLDRHDVACAGDEVMNYFQLVRPSENQIAYRYRCSKFK
jgi:hypothetical protein